MISSTHPHDMTAARKEALKKAQKAAAEKRKSSHASAVSLIHTLAKESGHTLTDKKASKIAKMVAKRGGKEDFYYNARDYFRN